MEYRVRTQCVFLLLSLTRVPFSYRIHGKTYNQEAKVSPFAIRQEQPGEFAITSIAHQQKMCKTAVTDLRYIVHPLPSAQVGHGQRIIQDIHEGTIGPVRKDMLAYRLFNR